MFDNGQDFYIKFAFDLEKPTKYNWNRHFVLKSESYFCRANERGIPLLTEGYRRAQTIRAMFNINHPPIVILLREFGELA